LRRRFFNPDVPAGTLRKFFDKGGGDAAPTSSVAETGAVCVWCTEGNGAFCTTLPEVVVTVMGIGKSRARGAATRR